MIVASFKRKIRSTLIQFPPALLTEFGDFIAELNEIVLLPGSESKIGNGSGHRCKLSFVSTRNNDVSDGQYTRINPDERPELSGKKHFGESGRSI